MIALGLVGVALAQAGEAAPGPLVVEADTVEFEGERSSGEGAVRLSFDGQQATAARFRYNRATGELDLEEGHWIHPDGEIWFEEARVMVGRGAAVLTRARMVPAEGRGTIEGEEIRILPDGRIEGEDVALRTCGCEPGPWSVEARQAVVELDGEARFRGGWVRICGHRFIPVPFGAIPLADLRTGLLLPRLGYGRDGLTVGLPTEVVLGRSADLLLVPELRTKRGLLGEGQLRVGLAPAERISVSGTGGWDLVEQRPRGGGALQVGWTPGLARVGIDAGLVSDSTWLADYAPDYLARAAPWTESLGVVGVGPLRLETDSFQAAEGVGQRPMGAVMEWAGKGIGPVATGAFLRTDVVGEGRSGWAVPDLQPRVAAGGGGSVGRWLGPLRAEASADLRAFAHTDHLWGEGRVGGRALLGVWGDLGALRHIAELGVEASLARTQGEVDPWLADERPADAWAVGPLLRSQLVGPGEIPLRFVARLLASPRGLLPDARIDLGLGRWQLGGQGDRDLQSTRLAFDDGVVAWDLGAVRTPILLQATGGLGWTLPGPLSELRASWRALADLQEPRLLRQGPALRFNSHCDCLAIGAGATWSVDREIPDFTLDLHAW